MPQPSNPSKGVIICGECGKTKVRQDRGAYITTLIHKDLLSKIDALAAYEERTRTNTTRMLLTLGVLAYTLVQDLQPDPSVLSARLKEYLA